MSGMVEVHEKMLAQLQQRNIQLQQEKAEVELRLRQATALLNELQSLWMDLPPKLADAINKVLSKHKEKETPPPQPAAQKPGVANPAPGVASPSLPEPAIVAPEKPNGAWFSFDINDMFGCTNSREGGKYPDPVPLQTSPPKMEMKKKPPLAAVPEVPVEKNIVAVEEADAGKEGGGLGLPLDALLNTSDGKESPRFGDGGFGGAAPRQDLAPAADLPTPIPINSIGGTCQMVHMDEHSADEHENLAVNMVELLTEVPGATSLIAEIDVLCNALQREAGRAHRSLEQRIETLKSEAREHRQQLEDSYLKTTAAQHEELELCKSKFHAFTAEFMPSSDMSGGLDLELCDADWLRCRRISEQRAKAGRAHIDWLEEYFKQRIGATEKNRDAVKVDFANDLEAIWQRKCVLLARFRSRIHSSFGEDDQNAGQKIELVAMKKDLVALEKNAIAPLAALAEITGRAEKDEVTQLKRVVSDAKTQNKANTAQMTSFLEESKIELAIFRSCQNAELFAHFHLRRRVLLIVVLRCWLEDFLCARLESMQKEFETSASEASECREKLRALETTHTHVQSRLQETLASRTSAVEFVQVRVSQTTSVSVAFTIWLTVCLDSRLASTRQDLHKTSEDVSSMKVRLSEAEAKQARDEKQLRRAQSFRDGGNVGSGSAKTQRLGVLVAIFHAWNGKRLETHLEGAVAELGVKRLEHAESSALIEPLRTAVHFAGRRAGRRATLSAVYCSWATQHLQHVARQVARREADVRRRTDEKVGHLRDTVLQLVDDIDFGGGPEMSSAMLRLSMSRGNMSRRGSAASSIAGMSDSWSDPDETRSFTPRSATPRSTTRRSVPGLRMPGSSPRDTTPRSATPR